MWEQFIVSWIDIGTTSWSVNLSWFKKRKDRGRKFAVSPTHLRVWVEVEVNRKPGIQLNLKIGESTAAELGIGESVSHSGLIFLEHFCLSLDIMLWNKIAVFGLWNYIQSVSFDWFWLHNNNYYYKELGWTLIKFYP